MKLLKSAILMAMIMMMIAPFATAGSCGSDCTDTCCAEPTLKVWGQSRIRLQIEDTSFMADVDPVWSMESRTRIGIAGYKTETAGVKFEIQDSRQMGLNPGTMAFNNGTGNFETGVHQAYFWYKPCDLGWLKGGRMAVGMHNERLVGKVDWNNTGRTFEGLMFGRDLNEDIGITGFAFQLGETFTGGENAGDPMFYGLNLNMAKYNVDLFGYMFRDAGNVMGAGMDFNYSLLTFGAYSQREFGPNMFYDAMFAMQSGSDDSDDTHSGMMFNSTIGMKLDSGTKLGVLVDYTTGDDPDTADEYERFNNLFFTGHRFNGAMDFFANDTYAGYDLGLMDLGLFVKHPINDSWKVGGTFHMFTAVEDANPAGDNTFGNEFDLYGSYSDGAFNWTTGLSMFSANKDSGWQGADPESAMWVYSMTTVNF